LQWQQSGTPLQHPVYSSHGGTIKRFAAKASFQLPPNDQIMAPHQLYEWAQSNTHNLNFDFVTENKYNKQESLLSSRFATAEQCMWNSAATCIYAG
jgi:hypothetical protein